MDLWLGAFGLFVLIFRLGFRNESEANPAQLTVCPFVSIIVPARNEAINLQRLLPSLQSLDYPHFEILVVDDNSSDETALVAESFQVRVIQAPERPLGWSGKNWACAQGAQKAKGQLLLFTDADTRHGPKSLQRAVQTLVERNLGLLSIPPYHLCETWWEKLLGLFHLLPLLITAYRHTPQPQRLYAIGQYLLFTREVYLKIEGHAGIASSLTDDMDLATRVVERGQKYAVLPLHSIYQVQMYSGFRDFCQGWKRLFRLGMERSNLLSLVELFLVLYLFLGLGSHLSRPQAGFSWVAGLLLTAGVSFLIYRQKQIGQFSTLGALFFPASLLLFTILSFWAILDRNFKKPVQWRSREYSGNATCKSKTDSKYA